MGFYRGPNIVRDGLVLALDAASPRSYPGTGTTWTDIITGITYTPDNNTPTFNTSGIAYIDFENSKVPGDNLKSTSGYSGINTQNAYTRIAWFNLESSDANFKPIVGNVIGNNIDMALAVVSSKLHFRQYTNSATSGTTSGDYGVSANSTISLGTWTFGAMVVNRSAQTLKMYLNGNEDLNTTINLIGNSSSSTVLIGGPDADSYAGARMFDGKIATVLHYNRELTASEILQNYNVQKKRYGL
jgi:hypothetical protein